MEKIKFYLEKYKLYIIIFLIFVFVFISLCFILLKKDKDVVKKDIIIEKKEEVNIERNTELNSDIKNVRVDVKGYVEKEGVYELDSNSRVIDAINKAGGLKKGANTEYINLSKKVMDEMIIIVYSNDQVNKFKEEEKEIIYIEYKCECPDNINDSCITENDTVNTNGVKQEDNDKNNGEEKEDNKDTLISINNATKEKLMTLPGIGESKAESIIKYRQENGDFKKIEDIKNVSGIGESVYNKIKDYIKI